MPIGGGHSIPWSRSEGRVACPFNSRNTAPMMTSRPGAGDGAAHDQSTGRNGQRRGTTPRQFRCWSRTTSGPSRDDICRWEAATRYAIKSMALIAAAELENASDEEAGVPISCITEWTLSKALHGWGVGSGRETRNRYVVAVANVSTYCPRHDNMSKRPEPIHVVGVSKSTCASS